MITSAFLRGYMHKEAKINTPLQEQQTRALQKFMKLPPDDRAILLYHGLGSGKTLSSLALTENMDTDVIVPASLRNNYKKEMQKHKDNTPREVMSYEAATAATDSPDSEAVVIDEAHRLGNTASSRSGKIISDYSGVPNRVLLSGTPIRNYPHELAPIIKLLNPKAKGIPLNPKEFDEKFITVVNKWPGIMNYMRKGLDKEITVRNADIIKKALKGRVDYHKPSLEGFPQVKYTDVNVDMSPEQEATYREVTSKKNPKLWDQMLSNIPPEKLNAANMNAFLTAARISANNPAVYGGPAESTKVKRIVDEILQRSSKDSKHKNVVYSNYLEGGLHQIARKLEEGGISNKVFDGSLSDKERQQIIKDYNEDKINTLLISPAGTEGLDLKGTRAMHIVEPHWNDARIEQAVGRGARYGSHAHLPEDMRNMEVMRYRSQLAKPGLLRRLMGVKKDTAVDDYLYDLSKRKSDLNNKFLDILKEVSAE